MHGRSGKRFGGTRPRAYMSETLDAKLTKETYTSSGLSDGELQTLRHLMAKLESPCTPASTSTSSSNLASSGISYSAFNTSRTVSDDSWIIDSGASDHMTSARKNFFTYSPCLGHDKVRIADGSLSPIIGKGSVKCTPSITLPFALHIPHFSYNLLSVSAITKNLNCKVEFFPSHCVIQELST